MNVFGRRVAQRMSHTKKTFSTMAQQIKSAPTGVQICGAAGCIGLGSLIAHGLSQPAQYVPANTRQLMGQFGGKAYAQRVRYRVGSTYAHLAGGLAMTAGFSIAAFRRGWAARLMNMNPLMLCGVTMVGLIGTMSMTRATPDSNPLKYVWWSAFNACMGVSLVPLGIFGGAIVNQAAMITAMIVGSISLVAAASPGDTFLSMGPMLGCGLGVVMAASLGQIFFPASSLLMNVALYGGLGLFGLFTAHDTQKILYHAQMDDHFDPIDRQFGIYMDTIQIFIRVVQILGMSGKRK